MPEKNCENCGNVFSIKPCKFDRARFCSKNCLSEGRTAYYKNLKIGALTGIRKTKTEKGETFWLFRCECGNEVERIAYNLSQNASCGCIKQVKRVRAKRIRIVADCKQCRLCNETLPLSDFYPRASALDGFRSECILCHQIIGRFNWKTNTKTKEEIKSDILRERAEAKEINDFLLLNPHLRWCSYKKHFVNKDNFYNVLRGSEKLSRICKDCSSSQQKYHYNSEQGKKARQIYSRRNAEKAKVRARKWYKDNHDRALKSHYDYRKKNHVQFRQTIKAHYLANKQQYKVNAANNRARRKAVKGSLTVEQWNDKLKYFGNRCYLCFRNLEGESVHIEHRIPIIKGGLNFISNIAPACKNCNSSKNTKTEREFKEWKKQMTA